MMGHLIELTRQYRETDDVEQRKQIAGEIARLVGPELKLFLENQLPTDVVDDVLQETLVGINQNLRLFRGESNEQVWSWCYHVARHKRADYLREKASHPTMTVDPAKLWRIVESAVEGNPPSAGEQHDLEHTLNLLKAVSPKCYEYLWKHYISQRSYDELAAEYGLKYDAMRMQIRRCVEKGRSLMK